ncbi:hypothetical protein [Leptospira stimsonii]|uniref:Transcriptional regulator n=1 Tax=Leptospira stimsonii TaxID=2202203 RepID=A0ABY2N5S9_9LEPT|nr:hypothetical protein [Leptospira stimsonii]TGK10384.1 hypothetical protein EHO98_23015 [Leptospira stimsonii]TGM17272.1 hypothetical protein EHQ90_07780 [Leptospira stimsonii]
MQPKTEEELMSDKANGRRIVRLLEDLGHTVIERAAAIRVGPGTYRNTVYSRTGNEAVIKDLDKLGIDHQLSPFDLRKERSKETLLDRALAS